MRWLNEPASWSGSLDALTVQCEPGTDFWRTTHYGFVRDSGHFAYAELGWCKPGARVGITAGLPSGRPGTTSLFQVQTV